MSKGLSGIEVRYLIWKSSVPKEPTSLVVSEGLSAIEELWKKQKEVDVLLRESREKQASMEVEAAVQDIELLSQEEIPATQTPDRRDLQLRHQSETDEYNRLKDRDRQLESRKEGIKSIPEIKDYLHPPKRVSSAPPPITPVRGTGPWHPKPRPRVGFVGNEEHATITNRAQKSDPAEQPASVGDIKAALKASDRRQALELWRRRRTSANKTATWAALYRRAGKDKKEFQAWRNGERRVGSAADRDITRALTTDWD